ncbi:S-layer homology domain-containing protein [Agathobaculum butyriciproducens]|uniref:S-layer homology domain-containing protein n=1 Tax=Agathobaculum butyriciproducens TaxID=1628085 RepID=UPI003AF1A58A
MKKRILSILLCLCMAACMLPTVAFAAGAENDKAIQLVDSGTAANISGGQNDNIYFGTWDEEPIKWRVLDDQTNTGESGLFLLSDALLGTGRYGDVYFDNSENTSNAWQSSTAKTWCNNFYGSSFSNGEQGAVLATTKSDEALSTGGISFAASENILNGDKVFFLSAEEAENSAYGFTDDNARIANYGNSAGVWWLRSPYAIFTTYAGVVFGNGPVYTYVVSGVWAARPAFNLNLNSVLFTSAAVGGKPNGGLTPILEYSGNEWKLTLKDSNRNFAVTETTASGDPGDILTLHYNGATTGANEYISVILADNSGAKYYGRVAQPTAESGTVAIKIPSDLAPGSYTLKVFSEQYNGDRKTDYASNFTNIALTVGKQMDEQFSLAPGGRYYFDLSSMNIPGTANSTLPDSTLHYVPFTYVGTVEAYKLTSARATTEEYAQQNKYPHSLFVADYVVTNDVSWDTLNTANLVFGKNYTAGGVDYTLRAPSVGSNSTGSGDSQRGVPQSNEWDTMLNKNSGYIQNWNILYSWGQDAYSTSGRAFRGFNSARFWISNFATYSNPYVGFRPVLEVLNSDTLGSGGLKVVTLDLGGGKLGGSSEDIQIIVKSSKSFAAPASDGLTRPDGNTSSYFMWLGSDGNLYAPGESVPEVVTTLTAQWTVNQYTITYDLAGGTVEGNPDTYTIETVAFTLKNPTKSGYTFTGWSGTGLDGENNMTVTIPKGSTGNRSYTAHWRYNGGGGSGYSYYTIKATAGAGGSISPSGNVSIREGRDQTFTITPDKGYAVANVKIDGKSIGAVKSYTFENVRRTHTIEVIFMKANGNPQTGVFVDVATGSYYEDAVDWAVENGITKGTDNTHFSPDGICTRAQAATFLWRAAGSPKPETRTMPFTDVPAGSYYYDAVLWAVENGITKGTSNTTFSPNMTCSRAQIVTFLWRSEKSPAAGTANLFVDVKSTVYYADAVLWAVKEDITNGTTNTTFSPDADCTRAQIVTFLWRCKK